MGLKSGDIVVTNQFTTANNPVHGKTLNDYIVKYSSREEATQVLIPPVYQENQAPDTDYFDWVQDEFEQAKDKYSKAYNTNNRQKKLNKLLDKHGVAFDRDSLSLSREDLLKDANRIQRLFNNGHTVQKMIISFRPDYLKAMNVLPKDLLVKHPADFFGKLDDYKLRHSIQRGLRTYCLKEKMKHPVFVCALQMDTLHVHCHITVADDVSLAKSSRLVKVAGRTEEKGMGKQTSFNALRTEIDDDLDSMLHMTHLSVTNEPLKQASESVVLNQESQQRNSNLGLQQDMITQMILRKDSRIKQARLRASRMRQWQRRLDKALQSAEQYYDALEHFVSNRNQGKASNQVLGTCYQGELVYQMRLCDKYRHVKSVSLARAFEENVPSLNSKKQTLVTKRMDLLYDMQTKGLVKQLDQREILNLMQDKRFDFALLKQANARLARKHPTFSPYKDVTRVPEYRDLKTMLTNTNFIISDERLNNILQAVPFEKQSHFRQSLTTNQRLISNPKLDKDLAKEAYGYGQALKRYAFEAFKQGCMSAEACLQTLNPFENGEILAPPDLQNMGTNFPDNYFEGIKSFGFNQTYQDMTSEEQSLINPKYVKQFAKLTKQRRQYLEKAQSYLVATNQTSSLINASWLDANDGQQLVDSLLNKQNVSEVENKAAAPAQNQIHAKTENEPQSAQGQAQANAGSSKHPEPQANKQNHAQRGKANKQLRKKNNNLEF